jgi:uncharacterized protein
MGLSLRDQLLAAGLLTEQQAKQGKREQHQQRREQPKKAAPVLDEKALAAQRAAAEKRERDLVANRVLLEKTEEKARRAQIRELVEKHKLPRVESDESYNFIAGKKVKRMPVDAALRAKLISGAVVIVNCEGRYEIVPAAIAERIRQRDPKVLIATQASEGQKPDENDPYKDYVVPDDLIW